jgi:hypothetical protein
MDVSTGISEIQTCATAGRLMLQTSGTRMSAVAGSTIQLSAAYAEAFSKAPDENEAIATVPNTMKYHSQYGEQLVDLRTLCGSGIHV